MEEVRIVVRGAPRTSAFCPVSVRVSRAPKELKDCVLMDLARDIAVPFQVEPAAGGAVAHWIVDAIAPGQEKDYVLRQGRSGARTPGVRVEPEGEDAMAVHVGGELFTRYIYGEAVAKPCLYPVTGPFGHGVTRAYPLEDVEGDSKDHIHQRSLYVAWGDVNGSDNWSEEKGHGRMVHRYFEATDGGPAFGRIVSLNDWVNAAGERLMQDRIEYRFYNVPPSFRLFDLDVTFYASDGDVRFGDTKEGGIISIRVATPLEVGHTGRIENGYGGLNEGETWGKRAPWCDYSGLLQGHRVGLAVFDHPANLRHPTYWHVRDYGLMTANPFGLSFFVDKNMDGSYTLTAGGRIRFRYRVLVHAGDAGAGGVRDKYLDWVFPPTAAVRE